MDPLSGKIFTLHAYATDYLRAIYYYLWVYKMLSDFENSRFSGY